MPYGPNSSVTSVSAAVTGVQLLPVNEGRAFAAVFNDSTATLYVLLGTGAVSSTVFSVKLAPDDLLVLPKEWRGAVQGVWTAAVGAARITEL